MRTYTYYPRAGIQNAANDALLRNLEANGGGGGGQVQAAAPVFDPPSSSGISSMLITLTTTTPGGNIYYTLDDSIPDVNAIFYTGPFTITNSEVINAITIAPTFINSEVTQASYTISHPQVTTPVILVQPATNVCDPVVFSTASTQFVISINITLSTATPGATIHYTTDGVTEPTEASTLYTGTPFTITAHTIIKAIAVKPTYANSGVTTGEYIPVVPTVIEIYRYAPASVIWFDTHTVGELTATVGTNTNLYIVTEGSAAVFDFVYDGAPLFGTITMGAPGTDGNMDTQSTTLSGLGNSIIIALNDPPGSNSGYFDAAGNPFSIITFNIYSW